MPLGPAACSVKVAGEFPRGGQALLSPSRRDAFGYCRAAAFRFRDHRPICRNDKIELDENVTRLDHLTLRPLCSRIDLPSPAWSNLAVADAKNGFHTGCNDPP